MYFRPHLIWVRALDFQPLPILWPGRACGIPYALLYGLSALTRQPLSRLHSFLRQVYCRWLHLYLCSTSACAIAFGFAFFFLAAFVTASLCLALAESFFLTGVTVFLAATGLVAGALVATDVGAAAAFAATVVR